MRKIVSLIAITVAITGMALNTAHAQRWQDQAPRSVECVAAFELMQRAAPDWTRQTSVQTAWQNWQTEAIDLTLRKHVDFDTQVSREMTALADQLALDPNTLSRRALNCVADAPAA